MVGVRIIRIRNVAGGRYVYPPRKRHQKTTVTSVVVSDGDAEKAINTIVASARTGNAADGKIFVTPVAEAIHIRTGEKGDQVL